MEIFLDTSNLDEIREMLPWGIVSGLNTKQKILLREKGWTFPSTWRSSFPSSTGLSHGTFLGEL